MISNYKFLIAPLITCFAIQIFKVIYEGIKNKKIDIYRMLGSGGMPSSHTAVVVTITTLIGKYSGITSQLFALSMVVTVITIYDALGVRKSVEEQSKVLNKIIEEQNIDEVKRLREKVGHTLPQVLIGMIIGLTVGIIM